MAIQNGTKINEYYSLVITKTNENNLMCFSPIGPMLGKAADKYPMTGKLEFLVCGLGANADQNL